MNKDKTVQVILTIAIALLYPLLIMFAVYTFFPNDNPATYTTTDYYNSSAPLQSGENDVLLRSGVAIAIAVVTTAVAVIGLRGIKEVMRGLVAGSAIVIFVAASFLAGMDHVGESAHEVARVGWLVASLVFLTALMYSVDRSYDEPVSKTSTPKPPVSKIAVG